MELCAIGPVLGSATTRLGRTARKGLQQMFARMTIEPIVQVDPVADLQTAIAALIKVAKNVENA